MGYNLLAFVALALLALAIAKAASGRPGSWLPERLLLAAVALRVLGSLVRYEVLFRFYGGVGDAVLYYYKGLDLAGQILDEPGLVFSAPFWTAGASWWGTVFLAKVSGVVLAFIGPSIRGGFLAFSLLSFAGLFCIVQAFRHSQPGPQAVRFAAWVFLWPSLWFWPSSMGKEAILVLAIGLTVLGYAGPRGGVRWPLYLAGLGLTFCVRPHVALVLALATLTAHWLGSWRRFSLRRVLEAVVAVGLVLGAFSGMRAQFGLENADFEGMKEFVEWRAGQTLQGGSAIGGVPLGIAGVPLAFVNVWMRPFPWEAHNATSAFAALEIAVFWFLVWQRRRSVRHALKNWRRHRLLRFALPFLALYTLMIGLAFGNLGIIARQRAPIFPFMLMMLAAAPAVAKVRKRAEAAPPAPDALPAPAPIPRSDPLPAPAGAAAARSRSRPRPASSPGEPPPVRIRFMPRPGGTPPAEAT